MEDAAGMDIVFCVYDKVSHIRPRGGNNQVRRANSVAPTYTGEWLRPVDGTVAGVTGRVLEGMMLMNRSRGSRTSGRRRSRMGWCISMGVITCLPSAWGKSLYLPSL